MIKFIKDLYVPNNIKYYYYGNNKYIVDNNGSVNVHVHSLPRANKHQINEQSICKDSNILCDDIVHGDLDIDDVYHNIYDTSLGHNVVLYGQYISIGYIEQHVHFPHYPHYFPHFFPHWNYLSNSGARKRLIVLISTNVSTPFKYI